MSGRRSKERVKVKWSQSSLELAFRLVQNGMAIRKAARETGIPFSTLQERIKNDNKETPRLGRSTVFSQKQEQEMADQIKLLAKIFYGCTSLDIRKMAYEYAKKNNISHKFNEDLEMAGRDWLKGFLLRNKLSSRKAEGTSINRATAFNKEEVTIFFDLLGSLMEKYNFLPRNIYNVDETGVSSVQEPGKIIAEKGQKRVGSITSGERGKNVTAVCAMSATGVFIPPMLIYPRQRHSVTLEVDGPRGAIYKCSKNGWINEDLFVDWLKHFAEFTKPSENEPILLVLDNHSSHISLRAYEFCKAHHIVMLSLPPHGSHRIQPMDVSIYGPFKTAYKQECNLFMKSNLGRQIAQTDIASLFKKAFQKVATIPKAESGFSATGIYPFNPDVFTEEDFLAADFLNTTEPVVVDEEMRQRNNLTPDPQIGTRRANLSPSTSSTVSESLLFDQELTKEITDQAPISEPPTPAIDRSNPIILNPDKAPVPQPANPNMHNDDSIQLNSDELPAFQPSQLDIVHHISVHSKADAPFIDNSPPTNKNAVRNKIEMIDYENPVPSTSKQTVTAKDLLPVPKHSSIAKKKQSSRKQHAIIITGTPLKETLLNKENRKQTKIKKNIAGPKTKKTVRQAEIKNIMIDTKLKKTEAKKTKKSVLETKTAVNIRKKMTNDSKIRKKRNAEEAEKRRVKRKVLQDIESNTSNSDIDMIDLREDDDTDIEEDLDNICVICNDYGRDNEMWYRCVLCGLWAHKECSGYDSPRDYKCDLCINPA